MKWKMKWKNEVRKWSAKILFIIYSRIFFFYEWSVLGQIRSEKMKWENEVQRFYLLFILEYSFFMNEVFWVKFEVLLGQ